MLIPVVLLPDLLLQYTTETDTTLWRFWLYPSLVLGTSDCFPPCFGLKPFFSWGAVADWLSTVWSCYSRVCAVCLWGWAISLNWNADLQVSIDDCFSGNQAHWWFSSNTLRDSLLWNHLSDQRKQDSFYSNATCTLIIAHMTRNMLLTTLVRLLYVYIDFEPRYLEFEFYLCGYFTVYLKHLVKKMLLSHIVVLVLWDESCNKYLHLYFNIKILFHHVTLSAVQLCVCVCVALQSLHKLKPKALAWTTRAAAEGIWEYTTHVAWKFKNSGSNGEDRVQIYAYLSLRVVAAQDNAIQRFCNSVNVCRH